MCLTPNTEARKFRPTDTTVCRASHGRLGGEQSIWLREPDGCSVSSTIHEIGHVVGLRHEEERYDRDDYVAVSDAESYGIRYSTIRAEAPGRGPFDYASSMYKGDGTIPPGISGRSHGVSAGDIDGVARLYGKVPTATTITTNPPGLAILVDEENHTTPVRFNSRPGTTHTLEVVSPQTVGAVRYIFGRWNDQGGGLRTISADSDSTWNEANYIAQLRMLSCAQPTEAGTVTIRPESPDDFYVQRQPLNVEAKANGSPRFLQWNPAPAVWRRTDRRSRASSPANSSNPAIGASPSWQLRSPRRPRISESVAIYTAKPTFWVDSNIDGIRILVDGESKKLPWAFPVDAYPNGIWVEAPAIVPEQTGSEDAIRYRFKSWSDGGSRAHQIRVPASGGRVLLEATREYCLRVLSRNQRNDNAVEISPTSEDGFYNEDTAIPSRGWQFAGWIGEVSGSEPSQTVVMDSAKLLEAVFTTSAPLQLGETKSVTLQASSRFRLYGDSRAYSVLVPRDSSELTVRFRSSSLGEVDLYVHRGLSPSYGTGASGQTRRIHAHFASASPGPMETITIDRASVPRLANDVYFIALAVPPTQERIEGTLSVEVRRSGIVKSRPQALMFVSPSGFDAGPQAVRLTHEVTGTARYKIESNASWLSSSPQEWVSSGSGAQEVSVIANTAGLALDTHRASLTVLKAISAQGDTAWADTGVKIPVTFAVVPSNSTTATSRRANAVTIEGGPQEGELFTVKLAERRDTTTPTRSPATSGRLAMRPPRLASSRQSGQPRSMARTVRRFQSKRMHSRLELKHA